MADAEIKAYRAGKAGTAAQQADATRQAATEAFEKPRVTPKAAPKAPGRMARVAKSLARPVGAVSKVGAAGAVLTAGQLGYMAGGAIDDATGNAISGAATDVAAKATGLDDLQNRMLSNDPAVSAAAVAEYKRGQGQPTSTPRPGAPQQPSNIPAGDPQVSSEEANVAAIAARGVPMDAQTNSRQPQAIEGSSYSYVGNEGGTDIITRPTIGKDGKPVIDPGTGKPVPNFTDTNTAFNRPTPPQSQEAIAAEQARVDQSRADYERNTTDSQGRRQFGGPASEALAAAQLQAVQEGRDLDTVQRQLDEQGMTPEQKAAYAADPAAAYATDATAQADANALQSDAYKNAFDMQDKLGKAGRLERGADLKAAGEALGGLKDNPAYGEIMAMAQTRAAESGESISGTVMRILSTLERDPNGDFVRDEQGQLKMKAALLQEMGAQPAAEIQAYIG
jgi:hypothetical protein